MCQPKGHPCVDPVLGPKDVGYLHPGLTLDTEVGSEPRLLLPEAARFILHDLLHTCCSRSRLRYVPLTVRQYLNLTATGLGNVPRDTGISGQDCGAIRAQDEALHRLGPRRPNIAAAGRTRPRTIFASAGGLWWIRPATGSWKIRSHDSSATRRPVRWCDRSPRPREWPRVVTG